MIAARLVLVGALGSSACATPAFKCDEDAQCAAEPEGGRCEADHLCSYPDGECDSGRRYGEYAGDRSRMCVEDAGTSSSSTSAGTLATLDTSASDPTVDPTTSATTTTTGTSSGTSTTTGESSTTGNIPTVPLGHWPLDDDGPVATDISGHDHHGARDGGAWVDGVIEGAIQFSDLDDDDGIEIGTDDAFDLQDAAGVTLMGWARFDGWTISNVPIIAKFGAYNLLFYGHEDPETKVIIGARPVLYLYPEGGAADGDTDGPLDQNGAVRCYGAVRLFDDPKQPTAGASMWHHYAGTYDVATRMMVFYVDGVVEGTTDASVEMQDGSLAVVPAGVQLGRWQASGPTLIGAIDDVRIYDVALPADEVAVIAAQR
jgi:hypothetical protein